MSLLRALSFLSTAALIWLTTSCGDPLEDFQVHFSPDFYDYTVAVWITDITNPDELLDGASIAVEGRDAARVFNYDGNPGIEVIDGRATMIIGPGQEPTQDDPIQFTVKISKSGYQDRYEPIAVYPNQTYQNNVVTILSTTNLPQGAHYTTTTASLNPDGSLAADLSLDVAPSGNQAMSISLPAGVTFFDEVGNQLTTGNLEAEVIGYEEGSEVNLAMRPGSSVTQVIQNSSGNVDSIAMEPSSFLDIKMKIGGVSVKSFENGELSFELEVPSNSLDFSDGSYIEVGENVQLVSLNDESTIWENIGESTVSSKNGRLFVEGKSTHLSKKTYFRNFLSNSRGLYFAVRSNGHVVQTVKTEIRNPNSSQWVDLGKSMDYGSATRFDYKIGSFGYFESGDKVFRWLVPGWVDPQADVRVTVVTIRGDFGPSEYETAYRADLDITAIDLPQAPPQYKATVQLYCENSVDENGNPTAYLYPPVGTMIWLYEGDFPSTIWPTYIVLTEKWNSFSTNVFEAGQTVNVYAQTLDGGGYLKLGHTLVQNEVFIEQVETTNCDYLSGGN